MRWELRKIWGNHAFLRMLFLSLSVCICFQWIEQEQTAEAPQGFQLLDQALKQKPLEEQEAWIQKEAEHIEQLIRLSALPQTDVAQHGMLDWQQAQKELSEGSYPKYADTLEGDLKLLQRQLSDLQSIKQYPQRQEMIQQSALQLQTVSVFQASQRDMANIQKTAQDHKPLQQLSLTYQITQGWELFLSDPVVNMCLLFLMIPLVYWLTLFEQEHHLQYLIRSTPKGRLTLAGRKLGCYMVSTAIICSTVLGIRFLFCVLQYPMCDASLPIQTLPSFRNSVSLSSIIEYVWVFVVVKWLMLMFFGAALSFLLRKSRIVVLGMAMFGLFLGVEWLAFTQLSANGPLAFFHFINVWVWLDVHPLFAQYQNLSIFQEVYSFTSISFIAAGLLGLLFLWQEGRAYVKGTSSLLRLRATYSFAHAIPNSLWYYDLYKWLWSSKAILLILAGIWYFGSTNEQLQMTHDQIYQASMIDEINQLSKDEQESYMKQHQARFDDLNELVRDIMAQRDQKKITPAQASAMTANFEAELRYEAVFQMVKSRWAEVQEGTGSLIMEEGFLRYRRGPSHMDVTVSLLLIGLLVPTMLWKDKRRSLKQIIHSTVLGRERTYRAYAWMVTAVGIVPVCIMQAKLWGAIMNVYGWKYLTEPIQSMAVYQDASIPVSIGVFFLLDFLIKCLVFLMISYGLFVLEEYAKSWITYMILMLVLLFGGEALRLIHVPWDIWTIPSLYAGWTSCDVGALLFVGGCLCLVLLWWRLMAGHGKRVDIVSALQCFKRGYFKK